MTVVHLDAPVSVFRGTHDTRVQEQSTLSRMLERIRDGTYQQSIDDLRTYKAAWGKAAYDTEKGKSLAFTPCCALTTRARKVKWSEKLVSTTGVVYYDIDDVDDPEAVKAELANDPRVVFAFLSPSGQGVKVGVAALGITGPVDYKPVWAALLAEFQQAYPAIVFKVDEHVKYLHALCFVSHDPAMYINDAAVPFFLPPPSSSSENEERKEGRRSQKGGRREGGGSDYDRVSAALHSIPNQDADYDTWLMLGMALHSTNEAWGRDLWDTWSRQSSKYDERKQASSWGSFSSDGAVTMGSLVHLAQQHGYRPPGKARSRSQAPIPDMSGTAPAATEEPALDERIYGNASRPARDPDALPYSDYTNALAFVRDHGVNLRYCFPWGKWLAWTGTHWQIDDTGRVMRWAKDTVKRLARHAEDLDDLGAIGTLLRHVKASLATAKLKALVENAQSELPLPVLPEDLDRDHWLLNATNGTVDLRTGVLQPHRREDLLTRCIPVAYDPQATCPTWDSFLERIMDGNANLISFLQRAVGYALTGVIREHVLLILWGSGRNGKSTFLNTLRTLLGPYAMKAPSELLMVSNTDRHPTERADLLGKRFVATIETEQGRRLAEVFVKEATGGDPIRARRMREDFWEFAPTHKVFLATNHKPVITGTDNAIWERMKLVRFTVTIPPGEIDTTLPDQLEAELPGILAWAVQGCLAWQKSGLGTPDEVTSATAGYRAEMDVLGQFIEDCCLTGANYRVKAAELYDAYQRWCDQNGEHAAYQRAWGMALTERGYEHGKVQGRSWWKGIALVGIDQIEQVDEVDEGRPKNGIKHKRNASREHNAVFSSTSSTSSTGTDSTEFDEGVV